MPILQMNGMIPGESISKLIRLQTAKEPGLTESMSTVNGHTNHKNVSALKKFISAVNSNR